MPYSPRVMVYKFPTFTVSVDDGEKIGSTAHPIVGEVLKAYWDNSNTAAGGSIYIYTDSNMLVGSIMTTNADKEVYFGTSPQQGKSSYAPIVADVLWVSGKGMGLGSSGILSLYYR